jgi:hypothetical protein
MYPPNAAPTIAPATAILTMVSCITKQSFQFNHLDLEIEQSPEMSVVG